MAVEAPVQTRRSGQPRRLCPNDEREPNRTLGQVCNKRSRRFINIVRSVSGRSPLDRS